MQACAKKRLDDGTIDTDGERQASSYAVANYSRVMRRGRQSPRIDTMGQSNPPRLGDRNAINGIHNWRAQRRHPPL